MHISDLDLGMLGANGIVGAGVPIAVGAAFANKYKTTDSSPWHSSEMGPPILVRSTKQPTWHALCTFP